MAKRDEPTPPEKKNKKIETPIELPKLDVRVMELTIVGESPLICHAWSKKAKQLMLDKQMKRAKPGKTAKSPEQDFKDSLYHHPDGGYGFPSVAFKSAAVGACRFVDGVKMTNARGAFHVIGDMVKIDGTPVPREDMVRIGMGVADIRYRGEFRTWRTTLRIQYNQNALSPEQIVNLFNTAGFGVGVGEWRPERDGSFGRFRVATDADVVDLKSRASKGKRK